MKTTTTPASERRADSSLDATLNPVELSSTEIVSWGIAFPRRSSGTPQRPPMWRADATTGTVLCVAGRAGDR
jgi:hypothetical protein